MRRTSKKREPKFEKSGSTRMDDESKNGKRELYQQRRASAQPPDYAAKGGDEKPRVTAIPEEVA